MSDEQETVLPNSLKPRVAKAIERALSDFMYDHGLDASDFGQWVFDVAAGAAINELATEQPEADLYGMTVEQAAKNLRYLAYCLKRVIEQQQQSNADYATFANWLDFIEGRTYAPGENQVWSDVTQPEKKSCE